MSASSDRYRKVAGAFTDRVEQVPAGAWDNPAPCEGWVARDVVGHLVVWVPAFFGGTFDVEFPPGPTVADDPAGAWTAFNLGMQSAFDDPEVASRERDTPMGRSTFEQAMNMIGTPDILIHTWDLARATGLDETLDADEVHQWVVGMEPSDELLRQSGQYGPRVTVAPDADDQTRLLAFLGRQP